jgi:hypothetical protein
MGQPTTETMTSRTSEDDLMLHAVCAASALLKILSPGRAAPVAEHSGRVRELPPAMPVGTPPKVAARRDIVVYGWPYFAPVITALAIFILAIAVAAVIVRA